MIQNINAQLILVWIALHFYRVNFAEPQKLLTALDEHRIRF
jgi:hypothetical protein